MVKQYDQAIAFLTSNYTHGNKTQYITPPKTASRNSDYINKNIYPLIEPNVQYKYVCVLLCTFSFLSTKYMTLSCASGYCQSSEY